MIAIVLFADANFAKIMSCILIMCRICGSRKSFTVHYILTQVNWLLLKKTAVFVNHVLMIPMPGFQNDPSEYSAWGCPYFFCRWKSRNVLLCIQKRCSVCRFGMDCMNCQYHQVCDDRANREALKKRILKKEVDPGAK